MRLWHYKLIPVLPTKQLKAMRYELGDMIKQYPNIKHPLVNYANNYPIICLWNYFCIVCNEMTNRNIKMNNSYNIQIERIVYANTFKNIEIKVVSQQEMPEYKINTFEFKEHNNRYLKQCYYNLQEKYDRGIITQDEWDKIEESLESKVNYTRNNYD